MRAQIKTAAEFEAVLERASFMRDGAKWQLMLLLTRRLGLRPCEIADMDSSWWSARMLRIPTGYSKGSGGEGDLPICEEVRAAYQAHMRGRKGRVFLNERTGAPFTASGVSDALRRLWRESGQQGSAYCGRRSLASAMADADVNLVIISKILRHKNVSTTAQYIGVTPAMMERALARVA